MKSSTRRLTRLAAFAVAATLAGPAPAANAGLLGTVTGVVGGVVGGLTGTLVGVVTTATDTTTGLLTGADWGYDPSQTPMSLVDQTVGATTMWSRGYTGQGIGVALIDTGAVPVQGLTSGTVVNGPDLSLDNPSPQLADLDGFGHGTHLAGIIAGDDGTSGGFKGVAPDATLLSVKVGSTDGAVDVSQVIAGIDWVVQHRHDPGLNIRVLNLSYGTDGTQTSQLDPLAHAVENAWRAGITVVVAAGNSGTARSSLDNPATDPFVIAVGADDIRGTASALDDVVPQFSSRGSQQRHADLVAPGQSIVSLRDPGSYVDTEYPSAVVNTRFFKGSGTSQAAAVVSGAAALLLQQRPSLTPDQVKAALTSSAQLLPQASTQDRGAGLLDVSAASATLVGASSQPWTRSTGLGTLEGARGSAHVGDAGTDLAGERDVLGTAWNAAGWASASASGQAWSGGIWNSRSWSGGCWCGASWTARTWANSTWTGNDWAGSSWLSHTWSGEGWVSHTWSGSGWVSHTWSSHTWSGSAWS